MVHQPEDTRPQLCRNRLRDEGQAYPRSGCAVCRDGGMMGCPHERRPNPPTTGSGVKPPQQPSAEAMVRVALEMSSRALAAVEAERDAARASLATATSELARLRAEGEALREALKVFAAMSAMDPPESVPLNEWLPAVTGARSALNDPTALARAATARER